MKRLVLGLVVSIFLTTQMYAGFWSSVAGGVVANSLSDDSGSSNASTNDKILQLLSKQGFYNEAINGDLNTFDSRSGIEGWQKHYKLKQTGILNNSQKQNMLYMHDLILNYKKEYNKLNLSHNKRLVKIFEALDKTEKKLSSGKLSKAKYLSHKFQKEVNYKRKEFKMKHGNFVRKNDIVIDSKNKLMWQDSHKYEKGHRARFGFVSPEDQMPWDEANKYCKNLTLGEYRDWRLPSVNEFLLIKEQRKKGFKNISNLYWTNNKDMRMLIYPDACRGQSGMKGGKYQVRCVRN